MEPQKFRDLAFGITSILLAGGIIFVTVWLLIKTQPLSPKPTGPSFSAWCEPIKDGYVLTVTIDNYYGKKAIQNVKCRLFLKGELTVKDSEEQELGSIEKGANNQCIFLLQGEYEGPVGVKIMFDNKTTSVNTVCRKSSETPLQTGI